MSWNFIFFSLLKCCSIAVSFDMLLHSFLGLAFLNVFAFNFQHKWIYYEIVCYWHEQYAPFSEQQEQPTWIADSIGKRSVCVWSINVEDANKYWLLWLISSICGTIKIANILSSILQCNRLRNTRWINYYKNINSLRSFSFLLFRVTNSTVYCVSVCLCCSHFVWRQCKCRNRNIRTEYSYNGIFEFG